MEVHTCETFPENPRIKLQFQKKRYLQTEKCIRQEVKKLRSCKWQLTGYAEKWRNFIFIIIFMVIYKKLFHRKQHYLLFLLNTLTLINSRALLNNVVCPKQHEVKKNAVNEILQERQLSNLDLKMFRFQWPGNYPVGSLFRKIVVLGKKLSETTNRIQRSSG